MKAFFHRQRKSAHFQKWNMSRNHILWLYANKIQQEKNDPLTLEVGHPLLRLHRRKKKGKWKLICQESPGRKVAALQNWWPQWKQCLVKDGNHEGWVRDAHVRLRKVTLLRAVIYHRDRVCIKSTKMKDLCGEVHEKLGANCRCSHPVAALNSPQGDARHCRWGTSQGVHLSLWAQNFYWESVCKEYV